MSQSSLPTEYDIKADPSHRIVTVAATQMSCTSNTKHNIEKAVRMVRDAAKAGAKVKSRWLLPTEWAKKRPSLFMEVVLLQMKLERKWWKPIKRTKSLLYTK